VNGDTACIDQVSERQIEAAMKRIILAVTLASSVASGARADTSTYVWQRKSPWNDAMLQAAAQICDQQYGVVENGAVTSAQYRRCMLKQGWRYRSTVREKTYIDPTSGMSCHNAGGAAICDPPHGTVKYFDPDQGLWCTRTGIVSVCSNF
jgi:hypothetical protein